MKTKFKNFSKKLNIVLIQGSPRYVNNCPDENSKTSKIIKYVKDNIKNVDFTIIDLKLSPDKHIIQPCKGCVSTAGGAHCQYPCSCYNEENDKMFSEKIYEKLEKCDAFIVFTPIHWSAATSQVKALFDRLVCINQTLTREQAEEIYDGDMKNSTKTAKFEKTDVYCELKKNHWEGKIAAFYAHGDDGADDYKCRDFPEVFKKYCCEFKPEQMMMPYVWQLRYSGIDVPDEFVESFFIKDKISYSEENEKFEEGKYDFMYDKAIKLVNKVIKKLEK
ncbi:MAG: flavodoxin family protein [Ignavibacteria bacterium]|nr:flavodoxin family protein [Ignavibacteria bacterium]